MISNVFSSVVKLQELHVDCHHAIALTHLAPHARRTQSLSQRLCQALDLMGSRKTLTVVASPLPTGRMANPPITVAVVVTMGRHTPHWHSVRLSAMHMRSALDSTCVIPVVDARIGSQALSILSQVQATTAIVRTEGATIL